MKLNFCTKERVKFFATFLLLFGFGFAQAQTITVRGTVTGDGIPLPGVNVIVKGTTNGTVTDFDGVYEIKADRNAVLEFSFLGFKTKDVAVNGQTEINVSLETDLSELDEVIVVGYGTQKKKEVTGAVAAVKADIIAKAPVSDLGESIQGQVAGVNVQASSGRPGSVANIQIRGLSLGNSTPLYVVDGVPFEGVPNIAPEQVESMDILKDGASAAIYGVRASNGVILITTKRGKKGKIDVELSTYMAIQNITSGVPLLSSTDQYFVEEVYTKAIGAAPFLYGFNPQGLNNNSDFVGDVQNNNALIRNYALSINGGSEDFSVSFNTNFFDQEGVLINSGFNRLSSRLNANYNKGKFKAFASIGLTYENTEQEPWALYELALRQRPWQVSFADVEQIGENSVLIPVQNAIQYSYISALLDNQDDRQVNSHNIALNLSYEIVPGLTYKISLGRNMYNYRRKFFQPQYLVTDLSGEINPTASREESILNEDFYFSERNIIENILTYNQDFGKHNFNLTAVSSFEEFKSKSLGVGVIGLPSNDVVTLGAGQEPLNNSSTDINRSLSGLLGRIQYNFDDKYLLSASIRRDGSSRFSKANRYGTFPGVSVGWNISEENFMKNSDSPINSLKVRASWAELGNQNTADYGIYTLIESSINYPFGVDEILNFGAIQRGLANADQVWERKISRNIGLDLAMFSNRLTFNADVYKNNRIDMLLPQPIPSSLGTTIWVNGSDNIPVNAGDMENKGVELALGLKGNGNQDFSWSIDATWTKNINTILDLNGIQRGFAGGSPARFDGADATTFNAVGYEAGAFFLVENEGLIKTPEELAEYRLIESNAFLGDLRFKDQLTEDTDNDGIPDTADGKIDENDRVYAGSGQPEWESGLNINVKYKNWDLFVQNYFSYGAEIFNGSKYLAYSAGRHQDQYYQWSPENPNTDIPTYRTGNNHPNKRAFSDFWLEDGTYFRIRNITLGYNIEPEALAGYGISKMRLYLSAMNPITITNYSGFDPEIGGNGLSTRGVDQGNYPIARRFLLGLQLKF
ncbi:TonB-dependent receptor [Algibacter sp. 2305UL17-15]|uniref:SusC/RagA family TonB-linked outer membrane protein n=1 Tax=Algibacter sp. 2305UL17-15 TaxID=3231268 RepID=UPI00345943F2